MSSTSPAAQRLASNSIAEELKDFELTDDEWSKACSAYLVHHSWLSELPDSHEAVVHFRLRRMEHSLERMYEVDGGHRLPYEFYAEGIAHVQEEVEEAQYAMDSAADPHSDRIPLPKPGPVPYDDFEEGDDESGFFAKSASFLASYGGGGAETFKWREARVRYLGCQHTYESSDTHDAHARFCVHRAITAFSEMESESQARGVDDHGFYALGQQRLADLREAAEYAAASAPAITEADRRARERAAQ